MKSRRTKRGVTKTTTRFTPKLNLNGHCIFCLRKVAGNVSQSTSSSNFRSLGADGEDIVPEAGKGTPNFINTFHGIWPYMHKNWSKQNNQGCNDNNGNLNLANLLTSPCPNSDSKTPGTFPTNFHPTICQFCAEKVQAVENIISCLRRKLRELRGIIHESQKGGRCSWRGEWFEGDLRLAAKAGHVGEDVVTSTLDFFKCLGYSSEDEDEIALSPVVSFNEKQAETGGRGESLEATSLSQVPEMDWKIEESLDDDDEEKGNDGVIDFGDLWIGGDDDFGDMNSSTEDSGDDDFSRSVVKVETDEFDDQDDTCVIPTAPKKSKMIHAVDTPSTEQVEKFICTFEGCKTDCSSKRALQQHRSAKHRNQITGKLPCVCGLYFNTPRALRDHQKKKCKVAAKDPDLIFKFSKKQTCDICGIKVSISNIMDHVQDHVGDYALKCPNDACSQVYSAYNSFIVHVRDSAKCKTVYHENKNDKGFTCETCGFKADLVVLRAHVEDFHERDLQNKLVKCPIASCHKSFCVRQSVQFHLNSHLFVDTTFQKCEHCNNKIKPEEIGQHLKMYHDAGEILKCGQCPFQFSSRVALMEHQFVHRHNGMYCDICRDDVKYTRHNDLREHYSIAHHVTANKFICEYCSLEFLKKKSWTDHVRLKHLNTDDCEEDKRGKNKKTFDCQVCKEKFTGLRGLIAHKIKVHGDQPFSCSQCEATFTTRKYLSLHEKVHAGIKKKFTCEVESCAKTFTKKQSLQRHVTVVHLGGS